MLLFLLPISAHAYQSWLIAYDEPIIYKRYISVVTTFNFGCDITSYYFTMVINQSEAALHSIFGGQSSTRATALLAHNEGIDLARAKYAHLHVNIPDGESRIRMEYLRPSDQITNHHVNKMPYRNSFSFPPEAYASLNNEILGDGQAMVTFQPSPAGLGESPRDFPVEYEDDDEIILPAPPALIRARRLREASRPCDLRPHEIDEERGMIDIIMHGEYLPNQGEEVTPRAPPHKKNKTI